MQTTNCCKKVLEAAKLAYANKTKDSIASQKLGSRNLWRIAKSTIPLLFNSSEVLSSASGKAKLLSKIFLRTLILTYFPL